MKSTPLLRKTPLKQKTPLRPISDKQREKNRAWKQITDDRARELNNICEWCHLVGSRTAPFNPLDGHHIAKRRYDLNIPSNCYLCHRLCHSEIEDGNIKVEQGRGNENKPYKRQG